MALNCWACRKPLSSEPIHCPHCHARQEEGFARGLGANPALIGLCGFLAGVLAGVLASRAGAPPAPALARPAAGTPFGRLVRPASNEAEVEEARRRVKEALAKIRGQGIYQFVGLDELAVNPEKYKAQPIAVIGKPNHVDIDATGGRVTLMSGWGSGAGIGVDVSGLSREERKELLRVQWPPHIVVFMGPLAPGKVGHAGSGYHVSANEFVDLGKAPQSGTTTLEELLEGG